MKSLFLVMSVMFMFTLASCSYLKEKVIPQAKQQASEKITAAIVKAGECKAVDQVKADVDSLLKVESDESMVVKAFGDDAPEGAQAEGVVSEICKAAAKLALPSLMQKGVPAKWECALSDLGSKVGSLAEMACDKI